MFGILRKIVGSKNDRELSAWRPSSIASTPWNR
jgi:hypothetical protein